MLVIRVSESISYFSVPLVLNSVDLRANEIQKEEGCRIWISYSLGRAVQYYYYYCRLVPYLIVAWSSTCIEVTLHCMDSMCRPIVV